MAHQILHPAHWKAAKGYANGMLAEGRSIFVGGQIGWNAEQIFESHELADQVRQTLTNIVEVLAQADAGPEHLTRLTWYIIDKREYNQHLKEIGQAYRSVLGKHFPAMTMVQVAALIEDDARVEIEATAVIPR